jgi:hypothetical protein
MLHKLELAEKDSKNLSVRELDYTGTKQSSRRVTTSISKYMDLNWQKAEMVLEIVDLQRTTEDKEIARTAWSKKNVSVLKEAEIFIFFICKNILFLLFYWQVFYE